MDQQRFDAALRALQAGTTRRAGLAGALGALLGVGAAAATAGAAGKRDAARGVGRPHGEGPCGDGSRKDNSCTKDNQCCTGLCNSAPGRKNRDGKGRCRCVRKGDPCTADKNCCHAMTCTNGVCAAAGPVEPTCSPATCKKGCCNGTTCVKATSASACGTGGAACVVCNTTSPICDGGTCRAGIWSYSTQFGTNGSGDSNFNTPRGIFVSADTLTTWVADSNNSRITIWTRDDTSSTTWSYSSQFGSFGGGDSNFKNPSGVFVSADTLTAWIADQNNGRIAIWTRNDTSSAWAYSDRFGSPGSGPGNLFLPTRVSVSADELTAWVVDMGNNRISIWTRLDTSSAWSASARFGTFGTGDSSFDYPFDVFVSADTLTVWVGDTSNNRIVVWTRPDTSSTTWSYSTQFGTIGSGDSNLAQPLGVFVSADTLTAWVADSSNSRISVWTRDDATATTWTNRTTFGTNGSGDSNFSIPWRVCASVDSQTVWVADTDNSRISVWTRS